MTEKSSNSTQLSTWTNRGDYYYSLSDDDMEQEEDEEMEDFHVKTTSMRVNLEKLLCVQNELAAMNKKCADEILKIEMKFHKKKKDLIDCRDEIIATVPGFWYKVITYHHTLATLINEEEEECLHYLKRIEIEPLWNIKKDFRIKFHFNRNPFFKNTLLVKELLFSKGYSQSTKIHWKNNNNLIAMHQQNVKRAKKRGYNVSWNSLFTWFNNTTLAPDDDHFAKVIKNDILKSPLDHFFFDDDGQCYDSMDEENLSSYEVDT